MKFIELTYCTDGRNTIFPLTEIITINQEDSCSEVFLKDDSHFKVKESLAEIERKICRLGGDVQ